MAGDEIGCEVAEWNSQEKREIQWWDFINMAMGVQVFCQYGKEYAVLCQYGNECADFFFNIAKNVGNLSIWQWICEFFGSKLQRMYGEFVNMAMDM